MSTQSTGYLVRALQDSRVLAPAQLQELAKSLRRYPDSRALARELINRQWLTPYQVNQLLQGSGDDLTLGPYIIMQRLGENPLGQIFKARHQHMNRLVTLTVVRDELLSRPAAVERFYQEIQAVSQLTHPNIVCAYDAGPIGETHFFAQEYVEGINLDRLVQQSGAIPVKAACSFMRQIAHGLEHAYECRLLHHDLKPANLVVTHFPGQSDPGRGPEKTPQPTPTQMAEALVKISNLGLSLLQSRERVQPKHGPDESEDFRAPEQMKGGQVVDFRSNIYSLGCISYYILAGRVPTASAPALSQVRRDVPKNVEAAIQKMTAQRPEDRLPTPAHVVAALGGGAAASDTWPTPYGQSDQTAIKRLAVNSTQRVSRAAERVGTKAVETWQRTSPRNRLIVGAALLGFLIVGFVCLFLLSGSSSQRRQSVRFTKIEPEPPLRYAKGKNLNDAILTTLEKNGLPSMRGKWYYIGPFDKGFATVNPPEKEIDLKKTYQGKNKLKIGWKEFPAFEVGKVLDFKAKKLLPINDNVAIYLYHEMDVTRPMPMTISFGSDDTLTVWLNGKRVIAKNANRGVKADDDVATFDLKKGKNQLLVKISQGGGGFGFYIMPRWPDKVTKALANHLIRDYPSR